MNGLGNSGGSSVGGDGDEPYDPWKNVLGSVRHYKDRLYMATPRWKDGVPSTLNYVDLSPFNGRSAEARKGQEYSNEDILEMFEEGRELIN